MQSLRIRGPGPGANATGMRPCRPTRETRMSSGPRRSPAAAIPAGRGDGLCCHGPARECERTTILRSDALQRLHEHAGTPGSAYQQREIAVSSTRTLGTHRP